MSLIEWLENHLAECFYCKFFGIQCPGCGMQRSIIALLKGNFLESLQLYPALIPLMSMFLILFLHLIFHFKNGATILKYLFFFNTTIILVNYLYKIFTNNISC